MKLEIYENNILDINSNYTVQQKRFFNNTITIVDNFYQYPQYVRNFALKLPFLRETESSYCAEVIVPSKIFVELTSLIKEQYPTLSALIEPTRTIRFRLVDTEQHDNQYDEWHSDGKGIAGMVYLNERHNVGGTSFHFNGTTFNIEGKWNRLVLFPMSITHKVWFDNGDFADTYRITQILAYRIRLNKILENK